MRRKKNDTEVILGIAQLGGILVLLGLIYPPIRQMIFGLGFLVVILLGVLSVGLLVWFGYRVATRRKEPYAAAAGLDSPTLDVAASPDNGQTIATMIERLRTIDWFQFEKVIGVVYAKQGYRVEQRGGANPDGGIDLILEREGERTAIQCKHWKTWNLGVKPVREFLGAMTDAGIRKGIVITLGGYTEEAKQLADKHGIQILNETGLANLLQTTEANRRPEILALLNDTRKYCPKCNEAMVLRTATKGLNAGSKFWGCSTYPRCRFTMPFQ